MRQRVLMVVGFLLGAALMASAQDEQAFSKIYIGTASCTVQSGAGSPEGAVVGKVCDLYTNTTTGEVYRKLSGTGNTGWVGPSALTKTDDTNVTLTLGGSATTALLNPASLTLGWTGTLSVGRGGTGGGTFTTNGVLYGAGASALNVTSQGGTNTVLTANGGAPSFSATPTVTSLTSTTSVTTPDLTSSANLRIDPTGDVEFNPTGNDILPFVNYDLNLGAINAKYLTLHAAELWVETLVAQNTIATIGGRVLVAPTNILSADLAAATTTITVKYNNFANGDRVYMEADSKVEFMAITSAAGGSAGVYTYTVTRNLDGSGANDWFAGDAVLNTGTTGDGFIDLYSVAGVLSGAGPTIVGNVRTGTTYNNIEPRWAIGNLNGLYGYSGDTYGASFGSPSGAWLKIDPTNGVRIGYDATTKTQIDASGNASFVSGNVSITSSGITLTPGTTAGSILGNDASKSYSFTVPTGQLGIYGFDATASGAYRGLSMLSVWGGTGTKTQTIEIAAVDTNTLLGVALFTLTGTGTVNSSTAVLQADTITLQGGSSDSLNVVLSGVLALSGNLDINTNKFNVTASNGNTAIAGTLAWGGGSAISSSSSVALVTAANTFTGGVQVLSHETTAYIRFDDVTDSTAGYIGPSVHLISGGTTDALGVLGAAGIEFSANSGTTKHQLIDGNGDWRPTTDNTRSVGLATHRYTLIRGVTVTAGDIGFESGFAFTESYKVGIAEPGIALVDPEGEVVAFFGAQAMRGKGLPGTADVDQLPHVVTTAEDRAKMDAHPEQRVTGYEVVTIPDCTPTPKTDTEPARTCTTPGAPIYRTTAEKPMPDPATGTTTTQRKAAGAVKIGGQQ